MFVEVSAKEVISGMTIKGSFGVPLLIREVSKGTLMSGRDRAPLVLFKAQGEVNLLTYFPGDKIEIQVDPVLVREREEQ